MAKLFPDSMSRGKGTPKTVAPRVIDEVAAVNQVVTETLTATGGARTLTYDGQTTTSLNFNADAATITAALVALSNVASGDIVVSGTNPFVYTYGGTFAGKPKPTITVNTGSLTGGTSIIGITTPGVAAVAGLKPATSAVLKAHMVREATKAAMAKNGDLKKGNVQNDLEKLTAPKPKDIGDPARYNADGSPKYR